MWVSQLSGGCHGLISLHPFGKAAWKSRLVLSPKPTCCASLHCLNPSRTEERRLLHATHYRKPALCFLHNHLYSELFLWKVNKGEGTESHGDNATQLRDAVWYLAVFTCSNNSDPRAEHWRLAPDLIRQDRIMWVNKVILLAFSCILKVAWDL